MRPDTDEAHHQDQEAGKSEQIRLQDLQQHELVEPGLGSSALDIGAQGQPAGDGA